MNRTETRGRTGATEPDQQEETATPPSGAIGGGTAVRSSPADASPGPTVGELFPIVHAELRRIAQSHMQRERPGHTLQPTALVHEAFVRLVGSQQDWSDHPRFVAAATEAMRRVLVDHARKVSAQRRGGHAARLSFSVAELAHEEDPDRVLALDEALTRLEEQDSRAAEVARQRFFAGLEVEQVAAVLGISRRTVMRDWKYARAWLIQALGDEHEEL